MTNVFLGTIFETNIKLVNMNENGYDTVGMNLTKILNGTDLI